MLPNYWNGKYDFKSKENYSEDSRFGFLGAWLGEGQHASVYKCYKRTKARESDECSTPLCAEKLKLSEYDPQPYAVKIVRDNDKEKIMAH